MYPIKPQEQFEKVWSECVIAINEGNRRLTRKVKLRFVAICTCILFIIVHSVTSIILLYTCT